MLVHNDIIKIFSDTFNCSDIKLETSFEDIDEWDSLGHMNLIGNIEKEFGIKIEFSDIIELSSVDKIQTYLKNKDLL